MPGFLCVNILVMKGNKETPPSPADLVMDQKTREWMDIPDVSYVALDGPKKIIVGVVRRVDSIPELIDGVEIEQHEGEGPFHPAERD